MRFIVWPGDQGTLAELGRKAAALAEFRPRQASIPAWFVLTPAACLASGPLDSTRGASGENSLRLNETVRAQLQAALARLCPKDEKVAVRSSSLEEDGQSRSFAGQFESLLEVEPARVPEAVLTVWKSAFSERLRRYRGGAKVSPRETGPAVLIQRMVDAEAAGVAFSADPVTGRRSVTVVAATFGLGAGLAAGLSEGDTWKVDRQDQILSRNIARKSKTWRSGQSEISSAGLSAEEAQQPSLSDAQVRAVVELARETERHFGLSQDIEWAMAAGRLYLLQARPITSLAGLPDPDEPLNIWDNSNITESYRGVTTPLTFTFARHAYRGVYRRFCELLAVPKAKIAAHEQTFGGMLGLIRGRIYYNLLNWYRVLALLPGFTLNRRFMEQMMGVKEPLPDQIATQLSQAGTKARLHDAFRLIVMCGAILAHHGRLPRSVRRFQQRLDAALRPPAVPLERMRAEELLSYFIQLEEKLLSRWDAPLLNDFFAMIYCGVLRRLAAAWCDDPNGKLLPAWLQTDSDIISAEPARRIAKMADLARPNLALVRALCDQSPRTIEAALDDCPPLKNEVESYLERFGDRCFEELKLESPTLCDDPLPLLRAIGRLAARPTNSEVRNEGPHSARTVPEPVNAALASHPLRRAFLGWVLRHARATVRDRENLRFERTRLFGRVRRIMIELGRRLAADGHLKDPRDVFYLELEEIHNFFTGTATSAKLQALASLRKIEFEKFRAGPPLPGRLMTRGSPGQGRPWTESPGPRFTTEAESRFGIGCCRGLVRGTVQIVTDPGNSQIKTGQILVTEQTDPGWILLFPGAKGLLIERGSLLSHSAIVARELGLPTVVAIAGVTEWLRDGDEIEMDGSTGLVCRLRSAATIGAGAPGELGENAPRAAHSLAAAGGTHGI